MVVLLKKIKLKSKIFILKVSTNLRYALSTFVIFNMLMSLLYICILAIKQAYLHSVIESTISIILHTFIATLTLTIPKYIDENKLGDELILNIFIFIHMLIAYLFLGILISMIFRKLTRG